MSFAPFCSLKLLWKQQFSEWTECVALLLLLPICTYKTARHIKHVTRTTDPKTGRYERIDNLSLALNSIEYFIPHFQIDWMLLRERARALYYVGRAFATRCVNMVSHIHTNIESGLALTSSVRPCHSFSHMHTFDKPKFNWKILFQILERDSNRSMLMLMWCFCILTKFFVAADKTMYVEPKHWNVVAHLAHRTPHKLCHHGNFQQKEPFHLNVKLMNEE